MPEHFRLHEPGEVPEERLVLVLATGVVHVKRQYRRKWTLVLHDITYIYELRY